MRGALWKKKASISCCRHFRKCFKLIQKPSFSSQAKPHIAYEPYFAYLEEEISRYEDHLEFLGLLSGGDYAYFYEVLDLFVLSSRKECFALTQIEAVQKGVPVVVTDTPGARMLVKSSGFGEVVPMEDPEGLAAGLIKVLDNPESYAHLQERAQAYVDDNSQFVLAS